MINNSKVQQWQIKHKVALSFYHFYWKEEKKICHLFVLTNIAFYPMSHCLAT